MPAHLVAALVPPIVDKVGDYADRYLPAARWRLAKYRLRGVDSGCLFLDDWFRSNALKITDRDMVAALPALKADQSIRGIALWSNNITSETVSRVANALRYKTLDFFNVQDVKLSHSTVSEIIEMARTNPGLKRFNLSVDTIQSNLDLISIEEMVAVHPSITSVCLHHNKTTDQGNRGFYHAVSKSTLLEHYIGENFEVPKRWMEELCEANKARSANAART